jgi:serine/threonine protein kinase
MDKCNSNLNENFWKTLHSEIITYRSLEHPFMVKLLDFKEDAVWHKSDGSTKSVAYMVMEYVKGGELFEMLMMGAFEPPVCKFYFKQML